MSPPIPAIRQQERSRSVFTIDRSGKDGMALIELAGGVTLDEIKAKTEATYRVALKNTN